MSTLNFNDADLKANREGRFSNVQMKQIEIEAYQLQKDSKYKYAFWISIVLIVVILLVIGTLGNAQHGQARTLPGLNCIFFCVAATFLTLFFMGIAFVSSWITNRFANAPIKAVEGSAKTAVSYLFKKKVFGIDERIPIYRLILYSNWYSWMTFNFDDEDSLHYFEKDKYYRVYYLPGLKPYLLSAEEIEMKIEKAKR